MIKICITLDDVLRAKTKQIGYVYKKYINPDINLDEIDLSKTSMMEALNFGSKKEFNKFLYEDYGFEIFAEATTMGDSVDKKLNLWHISLNDNEEIDEELDLMLANTMEFNNSIGFTYFFLSKLATRIREVYLPLNSLTIFDKCDIIITSDVKLLTNVPKNKIAIKINTPYNNDISGDNIFAFDTLVEFMEDSNNLKNIVDEFNKVKNN